MVTSLPAWDFRSLYRNHIPTTERNIVYLLLRWCIHIDDVVRFLDTYHKEKYVIVNCCAESYANYPIAKFYNRVKRYYIEVCKKIHMRKCV